MAKGGGVIGFPPWLRRPGDDPLERDITTEEASEEDFVARAEREAAERIFASMEARQREAQRLNAQRERRKALKWTRR